MTIEVADIESLTARLNSMLATTTVGCDGNIVEIRQLVHRAGKVKIEIYPNEHPPPHFHVNGPHTSATFGIVKGDFIEGLIDGKTRRQVEYFHQFNRDILIKVWNQLRPVNCPVGPIEITHCY